MKLTLSSDAAAYEQALHGAIASSGGDALVQQAERDSSVPAQVVEPILDRLGVWELSPREDGDELEAAAVACRVAGRFALPYPVAERLARLADFGDGLVVINPVHPRANVGDIDLDWVAIEISGDRARARVRRDPVTSRLAVFQRTLDLAVPVAGPARDAALALVLPCWTLLGMLDRAFELTRQHCVDRHQFGKRLLDFQAVQFQLADALVSLQGLEELAKYSLWATVAQPENSVTDALALRLAALEAANVVFRIAHQLHGAIGFCDEANLSWLSRHSQAHRRYPLGIAETEREYTAMAETAGLRGLFL